MNKTEFAAILPCYFGQKVQHQNGEIGTIDEIDKKDNGELLVICYDTVQAYYNQGEFKLILRKMEDMTKEESGIYHLLKDESNYNPSPFDYVAAINYLRSIGIDCDGITDHPEFGIHQKEVKI